MSDFMRDYRIGAFVQAMTMAKGPIYHASSTANYLIGAANRVDLTPVDRKDLAALAAELEITAAALRAVISKPKPVLLQAAE